MQCPILSKFYFIICFLSKVSTIKREDGKPNYLEFAKLMLAICTLSHGNSDQERAFSTNKYFLVVHRRSTSEKTIQAVRFVKDFINLDGGEKNVKVLKSTLTECLLSCQRWKKNLRLKRDDRKRRSSKREGRTQRKMQEERLKEKEQITQDIETICMCIKVADEFLKFGQAQLEELTNKCYR